VLVAPLFAYFSRELVLALHALTLRRGGR
jgi:hypothetical protein